MRATLSPPLQAMTVKAKAITAKLGSRWMVNEVNLHKHRQADKQSIPRLAKAYVNVQLGRAGMLLTQGEVERGQ